MPTHIRLTLVGILILLSTSIHVGFSQEYTTIERARGFAINPENSTITFILDHNYHEIPLLDGIEVRGSFTDYKSDFNLRLTTDSTSYLSTVTVPLKYIRRPGYSGRPEFLFYLYQSPLHFDVNKIPDGYTFPISNGWRFIVPEDEADKEQAIADRETLLHIKTVSDFDLTTHDGMEEISNFRAVPSTTTLYRSYHPFYPCHRNNPTEPTRFAVLEQLAIEAGIQTDIDLCGPTPMSGSYTILGTEYSITPPQFYLDILKNNSNIFIGLATTGSAPSAEEVYFNSAGFNTKKWLAEIIAFINYKNPTPPYLIHCAAGQDRTGIMCALISALCGASWEEIARDFEKSQRMGLGEFRGRGLVKYSLENFIGNGKDIRDIENLGAAVEQRMIASGYATEASMALFREKLTTTTVSCLPYESTHNSNPTQTEYYSLQGRRLSHETLPGNQLLIEVHRYPDGSSYARLIKKL